MAPVVESAHKPLISYCSSAPTVTNAGDYVFRTYPSDSYQGAFIADYVYNKMGKRRAAVVAILGDWGNGIKQVFTQKFTELGGKVVISEDYAQDSRDLSAQMVKVKTSDAEIMLFLGYTEASIAGLKQAKDLGITIPVFGGDAWDDQKIRESGLQEGALYSAADINVSDAAWKEKLAAKGGNATVCTPRSYDNVKILADVMGRVGTDGEKMKNELYNLKDYPGVAGSLSFDQNGDLTTAGYKVFTVKDKKSEEVK